jgi:alpha-L-fucosidase 2
MVKKLLFLLLITFSFIYGQTSNDKYPGIYDEIWQTPSENSRGSMPLGNGDIGINFWAEPDGSIYFFIGKTDAWDDYSSLLKVGKIRVKISPNPFDKYDAFSQRLDLNNGQIIINSHMNTDLFKITAWVDANNPVINLEFEGDNNFTLEIAPIIWRDKVRAISKDERHQAYGYTGTTGEIYSYPDSLLSEDNSIICFHRNRSSIRDEVLSHLGMAEWAKTAHDPLINNTFGYLINGKGYNGKDFLKSAQPQKKQSISITALTGQYAKQEDWIKEIKRLSKKIEKLDRSNSYKVHKQYWNNFWKKSYIIIKNSKEGEALAKSYTLQRFLSAAAGRGKYPIKFNGSIFNVDSSVNNQPQGPDFRQWGGPYWLQNTRLIYWPMLYNGDYDFIKPFFAMYYNALPFAMEETAVLYKHKGAFFPETMYFWGSYNLDNFGFETDYKNYKYTQNQYIRFYFDGALEVTSIMLDYYKHTLSKLFLKDTLLPFARQILIFYSEHYPRQNGKLKIYPSQALETYWDVVNPASAVAGLRWTLQNIIKLPKECFKNDDLAFFENFMKEIPELPKGRKGNDEVILEADSNYSKPNNHENAELYSVFPYRHFGVGKPNLDLGRNTYHHTRIKAAAGWQGHDVFAALLGLTDSAKNYVVNRLKPEYHLVRFPIFWGPNFDWLPDQDHGGNILLTLQYMLLQTDNEKLFLMPAWPKEWDVDFKLNAPDKTTVSGSYKNGKPVKVVVFPKERKKDVILPE